MRLDPATCRLLFASKLVARLATVGTERPHLVPMVFAAEGDHVVSVVDHKPKSTAKLQRLENLAANPRATLLVDHYDDDWSRLWWVRADATGRVVADHDEFARAVDALAARYPIYLDRRPAGPALVFDVSRWSGWAAGAEALPAGWGALTDRR